MTNEDPDLRTRLNNETSRIGWIELQRFYASGAVIAAIPGIDLIDVACCLAEDDKPQLETYLENAQVFRPDDTHARRWHDEDCSVWAVVVAPWVLVQEIVESEK